MSKNQPNFEEFAYQGPDDASIIDDIVESRTKIYTATGFGDTVDQRLATFVSTPPVLAGPEFVVRSTAFSDDNGRKSGAYFDALIAEATGRRVIATNAPGVEYNQYFGNENTGDLSAEEAQAAQELTKDQIEDLARRHSFVRVGQASMVALHNAAQTLETHPQFVVTASSMGSALAAAKLRAAGERGFDITGASFAEVVNTVNRNMYFKLLPQFGAGMGLAGLYVEHNPEVLKEHDNEGQMGWLKRLVNDTKANKLYGGALARDGFVNDLGNIDHLTGKPVLLTRGGASELSPEHLFAPLGEHFGRVALLRSTVFGDRESNPHDHPYTMTVKSVIDAANDVLERAS
jgi:hypothetical protein